jgi:DNA (cytosine-5)-methyltransferase 1
MAAVAYYNEIDLYAAQWLRNLIAAGHIAPGVVDTRSILDVCPDDLKEFTQCHFFAGVGVWSYALRLAGWADERPIWTGSCPCQPFSVAGVGGGFDDERHLWPFFHYLIEKRSPPVVVGEQVAGKTADPWLDLVQDDMEGLGYAFDAVAFPSAGVGAPHIRDRTYWAGWLAHHHQGLERRPGVLERASQFVTGPGGVAVGLAHDQGERCREEGQDCGRPAQRAGDSGEHGRMADTNSERSPGDDGAQPGVFEGQDFVVGGGSNAVRPGPTNGAWREADWLFCRDGKWRPVEPGTFPLAHGAASRVGRLRAYGNAINAEAARVFIETVMECMP